MAWPTSAAALEEGDMELTAATRDEFVPLYKRPSEKLRNTYLRLFDSAERTGADVGTNILLHGVKQRRGDVRPATSAELRKSVGVLQQMVATATPTPSSSSSTTTWSPTSQAAATPTAGGAGGSLESIAACESGGDPSAVGGGGAFRGKYQFTYSSWQSVGGSGDPAAAPEAEQDRRASMLLSQGGASHWPVCGP
jgi:Transglycosylase-like domain